MVDVGLLDLLAGGVATVLWWLLRQKDAAQSRQIDLLFSKHDEDAKALGLRGATRLSPQGLLDACLDINKNAVFISHT